MMWFAKIIRQFFFMIDSIIYNGITDVYRLLIDISRTSVLSQSSIQSIANRIYELLAIFMVFKIIFSLIMYVVNPDDFSDKSKGVSKIGINIVISLSLLVLTPYIFSYAFQIQNIILEDNSLGTLIFGETDNDGDSDFSVFNSAGGDIAFYTMKPFFMPNVTISELKECITMEVDGKFNKDCSGIDFDSEEDDQYTGNSESLAGLTQTESKKANYRLTDVKNYVYGVEKSNLSLMFRSQMALATAMVNNETNGFVIDYKFMFSTPIGIIVVLLLISFCMDVALRSVKLAFLQLVAPIPILSYIDPKSGKDGMFKKWYTMCFKTFISLFVRLLALYFAIFIITKIDRMTDVLTGAYQSSAWVNIFVIIGALMFAKQLPKILEGLGIKLDGDGKFTLNPLKKFGDQALGGKKILGFGAAGAAAGLAGATNFGSRLFHPNSWHDEKGKLSFKTGMKNALKAAPSALGGAASTMWRGAQKAMKEEKMGKVFADSYGEAMFAKKQREDLNRKGSTVGGRILADVNRMTGNYTAAQRDSIAYGTMEAEHKAKMDSIKAAKEATAREKYLKQDKLKRQRDELQNISNKIEGQKSVKDAKEKIDSLLNSGQYYAKEGTLTKAGLEKQKEINDKASSFRQNNEAKAQNIQKKYVELDNGNLRKQQEIDNKAKTFSEEERRIENKSKDISATISGMKANNNYYVMENGKIKMENGKAVLTEAAQREENELASNNEKLNDTRKNHESIISKEKEELKKQQEEQKKAKEKEEKELEEEKKRQEEEIKQEQEKLDRDENNKYKYEAGQLTTDGEDAKRKLDEASVAVFNDLKENNIAVQASIKNLEDLGLNVEDYTKPDGTFNKQVMFDTGDKVDEIDRNYREKEAKYEEDERIEINRFNEAVKQAGIDPSSDRVLAHKADDASHMITTKEAPGTQMSARTVDRSTFTRYTNEWTYNGPNGGGPGPGHHDGPPPAPPQG